MKNKQLISDIFRDDGFKESLRKQCAMELSGKRRRTVARRWLVAAASVVLVVGGTSLVVRDRVSSDRMALSSGIEMVSTQGGGSPLIVHTESSEPPEKISEQELLAFVSGKPCALIKRDGATTQLMFITPEDQVAFCGPQNETHL